MCLSAYPDVSSYHDKSSWGKIRVAEHTGSRCMSGQGKPGSASNAQPRDKCRSDLIIKLWSMSVASAHDSKSESILSPKITLDVWILVATFWGKSCLRRVASFEENWPVDMLGRCASTHCAKASLDLIPKLWSMASITVWLSVEATALLLF